MQVGSVRFDDNLRFYAVVFDGALWPDAWPFSPVPVVYKVKVQKGEHKDTLWFYVYSLGSNMLQQTSSSDSKIQISQ